MKQYMALVLMGLLFTISVQAQKPTAAWFGYFIWQQQPVESPENIQVGNYTGQTEARGFVTENPQTAQKLFRILQQLRSNGSGDINKCFIPRHIVQVFNGETLLYSVLVCFECDGIRFSNQPKTTPVKNAAKREKLMAELKALFLEFHYLEKGPPRPLKIEQ